MKQKDLETISVAFAVIKEIDKFLEIYLGKSEGPWKGFITISIGGYECRVHPSSDLRNAMAEERANAVNILHDFGVEYEASE
jgi:hypothetical protein